MTSPARAPRTAPRRPAARPAPAPARPNLRVVGPPVRRPRAARWFVLSVVIVFGALLASAVVHSLLVSGQAHLDQVDQQVRVENERLAREQARLADYQSPERIAREAAKLGMVPATDQTWVSDATDGTTATISPPTTEDPDGTSADELASDGTAAEGAR